MSDNMNLPEKQTPKAAAKKAAMDDMEKEEGNYTSSVIQHATFFTTGKKSCCPNLGYYDRQSNHDVRLGMH